MKLMTFVKFFILLFCSSLSQTNDQVKNKMNDNINKEIIELHEFFVDWFAARIEYSDKNFARFENVMAKEFEIISPTGIKTVRNDLVNKLKNAHGFRANADKPFLIRIKNINIRQIESNHYLSTYEEWQKIDGSSKGRLSTAIFKRKSDTPNGVEWLHVHETWLPEDQD